MADIMSILQSSYSAAAPQALFPVGSKFTKVDPTKWQGTWTGKDYKNQPFQLSITKVSGFRANVTFESSAGQQSARVFITSKNTFRIGDSSFTLTGNGTAKLATIVIDPNTGIQTEDTAPAKLKA
jgi:hypothetical protein